MKNTLIYTATLSLTLFAYACSSDNNNSPDATTAQDATVGGQDAGGNNNPPAAPTVGNLIDRMGRPAINTALTDPFDGNAATEDTMKDTYNHATKDMWATYKMKFAASLAVFDSLDKMCGNQFAAGPMPVAGRYDALAGVLADDQLYVDTSHSVCTTYLGVEANATNIIVNMDCGGRTPLYNTLDVTYSVLALGALSGISNGIMMDDKTQSATDFPFLATPPTQ